MHGLFRYFRFLWWSPFGSAQPSTSQDANQQDKATGAPEDERSRDERSERALTEASLARCNVGKADTGARAAGSSQMSHGEQRILWIRRANSMIYRSGLRSRG
jgi:hypothetical protein